MLKTLPIVRTIIKRHTMPKKVPDAMLASIQPFATAVKKAYPEARDTFGVSGFHFESPTPKKTKKGKKQSAAFYTQTGDIVGITDGKNTLSFDTSTGMIKHAHKTTLTSISGFFKNIQKIIEEYNSERSVAS